MSIARSSNLLRKVTVLFVICCCCLPAQAKYGGGNGTSDYPYLIYDANQMNAIGADSNDWNEHFKLMADIDLSDYTGGSFNIIGTGDVMPFTGVFDGNGHSISNFTYTYDDRNYFGLFGIASGPNMVIENLIIINPYIDVNGSYCTGVLVGRFIGGIIRNCQVQGCNISGDRTGGLVGTTNGVGPGGVEILNCTVTGSVTGYSSAGLLVGYNYVNSYIYGCYSEGTVSGRSDIGGLAGVNYSLIEKSYSSCTVIGREYMCGGLVGYNRGQIAECYSTGNISGDNQIGGIAGRNDENTQVSNCYSNCAVSGNSRVGGLVGYNDRATVTNSYSTGPVSGTISTGGLIGENYNGIIFDSFWDVNSSGQNISSGGTGKTTSEMMQQSTFINWDFVDIWDIYENATYPFIKDLPLPSYQANNPVPPNGASVVHLDAKLCWTSGFSATSHDVYFGTTNPPPFVGNQTQNTFKNDQMDYETTYFWRIDEISNTGTTEGNVWSFTTGPSYGGGTGRPDDPYLIYTSEQLNLIGLYSLDWDKHFKLMADIDLSQYTGTEFNIIPHFTGVFDGNNHTISNFTYTSPDGLAIGLFIYIDDPDAEIKHLGLIESNVDAGTGEFVGSLVGRLDNGTITNCYIEDGSVWGYWYVGDLVGYNGGTITNSYSSGSILGHQPVGGLVGYNGGTITNCYATGSVSGDDYVGGLVGRNGGTINNSYSSGAVSGDSRVGGLVGRNYGNVIASFWDIETSGQDTSAGGMGKTTAQMQMAITFAGWWGCDCDLVWTIDEGNDYPRLWWENKPGEFITKSSYFEGSGTEEDPYLIYTADQLNTIGLIVCDWDKHFKLMANIDMSGYTGTGFNIIGNTITPFTGVFDGSDHTISNFTYTSTGTDYVGFFGYVFRGEIKDIGLIYPNLDAGTGEYVGSLIGHLREGTITNCYVEGGSVSGDWAIGGLVGLNDEGTTTNCYSTSSVSGQRNVGGLVGFNGYGTITNCYSTGSVLGLSYVGGLAGRNIEGTITNSYSTGVVSGELRVGGLVGYNRYGTITNCYSVGSVSASDYVYVGGLLGQSNRAVVASFWDIDTSGQTSSWGGIGKTTAEMQMMSTFTDAGWDFVGKTVNGIEDIWFIGQQDYPHLWWEGMQVPMKLTPRTLNCRSEGNWVKVHLALPQGFTVADVDPDMPAVLHSFGFESAPLDVFVNKDKQVEIEAAFERQAVCSLAGDWPQELTVAGF
ncbi:MAG: GLUG motif-containing protein, partial [Planctomycetota bacterium]